MSVESELESKSALLSGAKATDAEIEDSLQRLSPEMAPPWLKALLMNFPLAGVSFYLDKVDDDSELGAALKWMTPAEIVEEATAFYPGISVSKLGYLPIGMCLVGSGDPYFLKIKDGSDDPAVVRIYHDLVRDDKGYPEEEIAIVCRSLSVFFDKATIE